MRVTIHNADANKDCSCVFTDNIGGAAGPNCTDIEGEAFIVMAYDSYNEVERAHERYIELKIGERTVTVGLTEDERADWLVMLEGPVQRTNLLERLPDGTEIREQLPPQ